jgi:hypothetical protein
MHLSGAAQAARSQRSEIVVKSRERPDGSRRSAAEVIANGRAAADGAAGCTGGADSFEPGKMIQDEHSREGAESQREEAGTSHGLATSCPGVLTRRSQPSPLPQAP